MKCLSYCLFETPLGSCGIAWSDPGNSSAPSVTLLQLPEATARRTESRIVRSSTGCKSASPPPHIAAVIERIRKHLRGELQDFRDVAVDLASADPFARRVYEAARQIPPGKTRTYGELAQALGHLDARAVGQALARNPIPIIIPCHRILAAAGKSGGFSAHGGRATKTKLLAIEGAISGLLVGIAS